MWPRRSAPSRCRTARSSSSVIPDDGVWSKTAASVRFELLPAFYQTRWFFVLCVVAGVVMLWIAYLLHVRQVATRMQQFHDERMAERIHIAHELHGTLLQGVLGASMQLQVLSKRIPPDSRPLAGHILERMAGVIEEGRQALRGLRASDSHLLEDLDLCPGQRILADVLGELRGDFGGDSLSPPVHVANGVEQVIRRSAFQQIAACAGVERPLDLDVSIESGGVCGVRAILRPEMLGAGTRRFGAGPPGHRVEPSTLAS